MTLIYSCDVQSDLLAGWWRRGHVTQCSVARKCSVIFVSLLYVCGFPVAPMRSRACLSPWRLGLAVWSTLAIDMGRGRLYISSETRLWEACLLFSFCFFMAIKQHTRRSLKNKKTCQLGVRFSEVKSSRCLSYVDYRYAVMLAHILDQSRACGHTSENTQLLV